jgi:hypothetical protein
MNWQNKLVEIDNILKSVSMTRDQHNNLYNNILSIQHYINTLEAKHIDNDKSRTEQKAKEHINTNGYT